MSRCWCRLRRSSSLGGVLVVVWCAGVWWQQWSLLDSSSSSLQHHPQQLNIQQHKQPPLAPLKPQHWSVPKQQLQQPMNEKKPNNTTSVVAIDTPTIAKEDTAVCATLPGRGLVEGGFMGYQVYVRMTARRLDTKQPQPIQEPTLVCLALYHADILQLYTTTPTARSCHQHVLIQLQPPPVVVDNHNNTTTTITPIATTDDSSSSVQSLFLLQTPDLATGLAFLLQHYSASSTTVWWHWTDPRETHVIPRQFPSSATTSSSIQPATRLTWEHLPHSPEQASEYHELFRKPRPLHACRDSRTFNRALVQQYLVHCRVVLPTTTATLPDVVDWMQRCVNRATNSTSSSVNCQGPPNDRHTKWLFLQRLHEIDLPPPVPQNTNPGTATTVSNHRHWQDSHNRIHALLHGTCHAQWDAPYGAWDAHGRPNYVHNATSLRHSTPVWNVTKDHVCQTPLGHGDEGPYGYPALQKIRIVSSSQQQSQPPRLLCMVYTHSQRHFRLQSIAETWGPHCDGFWAASNATDASIGAVHLGHEGPEVYDNMWMKVRAMFQYTYDHYLNDYDYFHIGGDDHYVIPENIRHLVTVGSWKGPYNTTQPLFLGGSLALNEKRRYCNGGSGYTLNRAALRLLVEDLFPHPQCMPHWPASYEDRLVSACFRSAGISCMDTNDDRNETRYHTWNADQHAAWQVDKPGQDWKKLVDFHGIAWLPGMGQISETSVSFHLKRPNVQQRDSGMRRYHAILYGLCNSSSSRIVTP